MRIIIKEKKNQEIHRICIPRCFCSFSINCMIRTLKSKLWNRNSGKKPERVLTKEQYKEAKAMLKTLNKDYKGLEIITVDTDHEMVKVII